MTGSVSRGKSDPSRSLQMMGQREVKYAGSKELRRKILKEYGIPPGQQIVPGQERFPERQKPGMMQENV